MGIVAGKAAILIDDTVKLPLHEIIVALGTQIRSCFEEKRLVFGGVGIVTVHASPVCGRFVGHRLRGGIVMAL
jgi:hypothetical protein